MTNYYLRFCLCACLLLFFTSSYGQATNATARQTKKLLRQGDTYFNAENYHQAEKLYMQAAKADSTSGEALFQCALSHLMLYGDQRVLDELARYEQRYSPELDRHYYYWLGRAYHANMQFDEAVQAYERYVETLGKNDSRREEVQQLMLQTGFGKTYTANPTDYFAKPLGAPLNSKYSDHSPIITQDRQTLIFTSRRTENKKGEEITPRGDAYENIYVASQTNGAWTKPNLVDGNVNKKKQHTSNVQLFDNENKMLLYKSVKFGSLFMSEKTGNTWSKPMKFNKYTHTSRYEPNGFVIKDESVIYFASGRENKNGNLDLFVSRRGEDSTWQEPERLPNTINTDADEDAPFLSEDGLTLYFCSRGHDSMGGFDVFKTTYEPSTKQWSKPMNMGYPVNTPQDDIYFIADSLNKTYYVASNRAGTIGQEDIFAVKLFGNVLVRGTVTDQQTGIALPDLSVTFTAEKKPALAAQTITGPNGRYGAALRSNYRYVAEVKNAQGDVLLLDAVELPLAENDSSELVKDFRVNLPSDALPAAAKRLRVQNLNLVKLQYQPFDSLIIVGVVSDSSGRVTGAQVQLRQEENETALQSATTSEDGRYSFRVVPGKATDYVVDVIKPGYLLNSTVILYNDQVGFRGSEIELQSTMVNAVDANTLMNEIKVGAKQVLGGVYFEFNSAKLLPESAIALNKLHNFLQENSTIRMEIGGHTDNIGTAYANRIISQKRAQAVVNYLVRKGIPKSRVTAAGYGDAQPIATNEAALNGRDVNRRVEIKILSK